MRKIFVGFLFLFQAFALSAQTLTVNVKTVHVPENAQVRLFVAPIEKQYAESVECLPLEGDVRQAHVPLADSHFYQVICVKDGVQLLFPLHFLERETVSLQMDFSQPVPLFAQLSPDNEAMSAFTRFVFEHDKTLWTKPFDSPNDVKPFLQAYTTCADSLIRRGVHAEVADYLSLWAYTHTFDAYTSLPHAAGLQLETLPFRDEELLGNPVARLDSPLALLFRSTPRLVYSGLADKKDLNLCLTHLVETYKDSTVVKAVKKLIVENYLGRFDYEHRFDEGLNELRTATEKYNLDPSYLADFEKCKATIKGQPFPEGIRLRDKEGRTVDFKKFSGKYVYIDLWASWCRPCCREIPHLQKLEAELQNDKVEFVSISIDSGEGPWLRKVEELNLHGNQLIDVDNALGKALNVRGIPFFIIYGPDGRLFLYDAPRPSQGEGLKQLLEGLQ